MTNIVFLKNNQSRFVKHGFSWQIACCGPISFLMRSQWLLALIFGVCMYLGFLLSGVLTIVVLDLPDTIATIIGLAVVCGTAGAIGNRISARAYVKDGWVPIGEFPADWNTPTLIKQPTPVS